MLEDGDRLGIGLFQDGIKIIYRVNGLIRHQKLRWMVWAGYNHLRQSEFHIVYTLPKGEQNETNRSRDCAMGFIPSLSE